MIHQLKIESVYFTQIKTGVKTFEVRYNDRNFQAGDYLGLNEIIKGEEEETTGRFLLVKVLNVFDNPAYVKDGFVIMSILPCAISEAKRYYAQSYTEHIEDLEGGVPCKK